MENIRFRATFFSFLREYIFPNKITSWRQKLKFNGFKLIYQYTLSDYGININNLIYLILMLIKQVIKKIIKLKNKQNKNQ